MSGGIKYAPDSIFHSAEQGDVDGVKLHIKREGIQVVKETDAFGKTPLLVSAMEGHRRVVQILLKYGSDIRHVDVLGNSALTLAAFYGRTKVVKILLAHNQYVPSNYLDKVENDHHYLEQGAATENLNKSSTAKVNILHTNVNQESALMLAAMQGHHDIVKVLLQEDSSKKHRKLENTQGLTYADLAEMYGQDMREE